MTDKVIVDIKDYRNNTICKKVELSTVFSDMEVEISQMLKYKQTLHQLCYTESGKNSSLLIIQNQNGWDRFISDYKNNNLISLEIINKFEKIDKTFWYFMNAYNTQAVANVRTEQELINSLLTIRQNDAKTFQEQFSQYLMQKLQNEVPYYSQIHDKMIEKCKREGERSLQSSTTTSSSSLTSTDDSEGTFIIAFVNKTVYACESILNKTGKNNWFEFAVKVKNKGTNTITSGSILHCFDEEICNAYVFEENLEPNKDIIIGLKIVIPSYGFILHFVLLDGITMKSLTDLPETLTVEVEKSY